MKLIRSLIIALSVAAFALSASAQLTSEGTGPVGPQSLTKTVAIVKPVVSKVTTTAGPATNNIVSGPGILVGVEVQPLDATTLAPPAAQMQFAFYDSGTSYTSTAKRVCNDLIVASGTVTQVLYTPAVPIQFKNGFSVRVIGAASTNGQYNVLWKQ